MPPDTLAAGALVVLGAYLVFGLTGFGSTVLALPLLAHMVPLKFAVPLLLLLDLAAGLALWARVRRGVRLDELAWLAPFMLVGIGIGLTLLIRLPEGPLIASLGVFVLAYAAYGLLRAGGPPRLARAWCVPVGVAGGAFSALFGTGGVIFALYVGGRLADKGEIRATAAASILLSALIRIVLFGGAGLLTQEGLPLAAAWMLPAALGGLYLGYRLHAAVPAATVVRALYLLLGIAGVSLLARATA